jgi:hypothetical protein
MRRKTSNARSRIGIWFTSERAAIHKLTGNDVDGVPWGLVVTTAIP